MLKGDRMQPSKAFQKFATNLAVGQTKPMVGYLYDMLFGISAGHSAMLSEIGRTLGEDADLMTTEMRLSRNLVNRSLDESAVRSLYLDAAKPFLRDAVVALDFSEIRKEYSRKQEWLCGIWDDSRKEQAKGYWLLNIEAVAGDGRHFPLWLEPFSQNAPNYESQAHVVENGVKQVAAYVGKRCIWVLDRGFDGATYISLLESAGLTYCIRQVGKRTVVAPGGQELSTSALAAKMEMPHLGKWRYLRNGKEHPVVFRYGSADVTFPKDGKTRRLVSVQLSGYKTPMLLLTNSMPGSPDAVLRIVVAYLKRWGIEEGTRLVKQTFDIENVRAMSFAGIRRLVLFAYLAYGFLCLFAKRASKRALRALLGLYKSFGSTPHFVYYRLANALASALARAGP
jgi:Transposase DDE domain